MFNPFKLVSNLRHSDDQPEVVDLAEVDLEFERKEPAPGSAEATAEAAPKAETKILSPMVSVPATAEDVADLELFQGIEAQYLKEYAPLCQLIRAIPGYVFYPAGRFNTRLFLVLEGQLRQYPDQGERRPKAIVDMGQSCGLTQALGMVPADHSLIATEETRVLAIELNTLNKLTARSHIFAQNYAALMAKYTRGDNCVQLGANGVRPQIQDGFIDRATLLHNQNWLDTMLPRILERARKAGHTLSAVAIRVDRLSEIDRESGVVLSPYVLEAAGRLMVENSRPTDLHVIDRSRKLLALLPNTPIDGARVLANRLSEQIRNVASIDGLPLPPITLSVAVVEVEGDESATALLGRAEALLDNPN